jgi:hypothetical protein
LPPPMFIGELLIIPLDAFPKTKTIWALNTASSSYDPRPTKSGKHQWDVNNFAQHIAWWSISMV